MTIELENHPAYSENGPPASEFLARICQPLASWTQTLQEKERFLNLLTGPDGLIEEAVQKLTQASVNAAAASSFLNRRQISSQQLARVESRLQRNFRAAATAQLLSPEPELGSGMMGTIKGLLNRVDPTGRKQLLAESAAVQSRLQEVRRTIRQFAENASEPETLLVFELQNFLNADFAHLLQLPSIITQDENLLRFLKDGHQDILSNSTSPTRQQELQKPNPQRITQFLDQMATDYYQRGKKNSPWPLVEFFLPIDSDQIQDLYKQDDNSKRRQLLFELISRQLQMGKSLPPPFEERYAVYLSHLQGEAIRQIQEAIVAVKLKELTIPRASANLEDLLPGSEEEPNPVKPSPQPPNQPETASPQKKALLIADQICEDETSIRQQLTTLISQTTKNFRQADIDSYTFILAKLAGLRLNASKHELKKLHDFPRVLLSDGSQEPVLRLRLWDKAPPRLFIAFHGNFLIVISAIDRDDNTYRQLMRKGGFSQIQLPS